MTRNLILTGITPALPATPRPLDCAGCGRPFVRARASQRLCRPGCGRRQDPHNGARTYQRTQPRHIIGIDGEGVTEADGTHRYVLLSCGDKHLSLDGAHLDFRDVMPFLWAQFEANPKAIYVGFYLQYDFAQWLRTLPEERARMLLDKDKVELRRRKKKKHAPPFLVQYAGWSFDYLPGKRFRFCPDGPPPKKAPKKLVWKDYLGVVHWKLMHINDAGSYFQSTFLKAIDPNNNPNPVVTPEEYGVIERGKARRDHAIYDPAMIEYNQLECEVLARLIHQLEVGVRQEGLKPRRDQWHGPGQIAQLWMRKIKLPEGETLRELIPEAARLAARHSYMGGWFEIFWHGPVKGLSYGHDINSAYPYVMAGLPCLLHGEWVHVREREKGRRLTWAQKDEVPPPVRFIRAHVKGEHPLVGAMGHRNKNRTILRPHETCGWFVASELFAAIQAGFVKEVLLYESWTFKQHCSCPPPMAPLADLYKGRLVVGKQSPAGKARKLIYNSVAGKWQQSVGEPVFGNSVYATLITAGCRTMILNAIRTHPNNYRDLLMVATDGVVFRTPHPGLDYDAERLGAWSQETHENLSLFMPGVYWDDRARDRIRRGEGHAFKSRGVAAKDLTKHIADIDRAWERFAEGGWPQMTLDVSFSMVSLKQALARKKWHLAGTLVRDAKRVISADPKAKRLAWAPGLSLPWHEPQDIVSLPYDGKFGDEIRAYGEENYGDHPDAPIGELLAEMLLDN